MRIFYASDTTPNAAFQSNLWRNNLYLPLVDLGHEVIEFDYDLRETFLHLDTTNPADQAFIAHNRPRVSEALVRQIRAAHAEKPIALLFTYFYDACVLPEALDEIRAMGIKTMNWYCNGSYQLHLVAEISPHYDWCLVPEKFRLQDYVNMGATPIYCQQAANPTIYKPHPLPVEFDVTFVGQAYGERPAYINYLHTHGVGVRVWGQGWQRLAQGIQPPPPQPQFSSVEKAVQIGRKLATPEGWQAVRRRANKWLGGHMNGVAHGSGPIALPPAIVGGILGDDELIQMYSRSKINIGFSTCGGTQATDERIVQIRMRDFEVPMSGGFYMIEYMEELEEFYEIGKEVVCYYDQDDLVEKIKYYLAHDQEREAIRQAGYRRAVQDHSWHKRFQQAFAEAGLN